MGIARRTISTQDLLGGNFSFLSQVSSKPENINEFGFQMVSGVSPRFNVVNVSVTHELRLNKGDADLRVFDDRDRDGRLDTDGSEPAVAQSTQKSGINEFISFQGLPGKHYVIGVVNNRGFAPNGSVFYTLRASITKSSFANPLATPEIPLGTIAQDLRKTDRVNDNDTADNFAFSLGANDKLNISVKELGNLSGDVNSRIVRDLDRDGLVDKNEIVSKGVSSLKGNIETISRLQGAGDYILQVCQSQGNTKFEVKFDHTTA